MIPLMSFLNAKVIALALIAVALAYTHYKAYDIGQATVEAKYLEAVADANEKARELSAVKAKAARAELNTFKETLEKDRVDAKQELAKVGTPCPADADTARLLNGLPSVPK